MRRVLLAVLLSVGCSSPTAPTSPPAGAPDGGPHGAPDGEAVAPTPARPPVLHLSIPDAVAEGRARYKADWSFDLRATEAWSVHVHVIPPGQLVPLHRHPDNEELALVMGGAGEWETVWVADERRTETWTLGFGDAVYSAPGSAHQVRNRGPETLATVVVQRPEFGQNWYLLADEVMEGKPSVPVRDVVPPMFEGWSVAWAGPDETAGAADRERLGFVVEGEGTLSFEDTTLPLRPGHFFKVPPGLSHRVAGPLRFLEVRVGEPPALAP